MDPHNRNKANCNITKGLLEALMHLIKLQKEREIVIKRSDKGAGVIIVNFKDYMSACLPTSL